MNKAIRALQKKLERLELEHLRRHALDLHERLEAADEARCRADDNAEFWRESFMRVEESLLDDEFATHRCIGISKTGELMVVTNAPA